MNRLITSLIFLFFGGSDIVEVQTGASWSPWWLFIWKASCVLSMAILFWVYLRDRPLANKP